MKSAAQVPSVVESANSGEPKAPRKRTYNGAARAEQKLQTQSRVLQAALERFAEVGFEAASVRDIAHAAGLSHAIIRLHYGSKEELWKSAARFLFDRMFQEMPVQDIDEAVQHPRDALEILIRAYSFYCAQRPEHLRLMMHESIRGGERLDWMVQNFIAPAHRRLEPLLKAAVAQGVLPQVPLLSLVYTLSGAAQALFALAAEARAIYGVDALDPAVVKAHGESLISMLLQRQEE